MISELEMDQAPRVPKTLGEYRVGISFNPGGHEMVNKIKRAAADLIDLINSVEPPSVKANVDPDVYWGETERLIALAMTQIELAAMWAVKAATKPAP